MINTEQICNLILPMSIIEIEGFSDVLYKYNNFGILSQPGKDILSAEDRLLPPIAVPISISILGGYLTVPSNNQSSSLGENPYGNFIIVLKDSEIGNRIIDNISVLLPLINYINENRVSLFKISVSINNKRYFEHIPRELWDTNIIFFTCKKQVPQAWFSSQVAKAVLQFLSMNKVFIKEYRNDFSFYAPLDLPNIKDEIEILMAPLCGSEDVKKEVYKKHKNLIKEIKSMVKIKKAVM